MLESIPTAAMCRIYPKKTLYRDPGKSHFVISLCCWSGICLCTKAIKCELARTQAFLCYFYGMASLLGRSGQLIGTTRRQHDGVFVLRCWWTKIKQKMPFMIGTHRSVHTVTHVVIQVYNSVDTALY